MHPLAEAEIGEDLDEVEAADGRAVQQVLPLPAPVQPARDRELAVVDRASAVRVVEQELDLAELGGAPAGRAGEDDVVRLLRPELGRAQRAGRPADRVGDVRLPGAVRPDDDRDARLETNLDGIGERLEAAQLDRT